MNTTTSTPTHAPTTQPQLLDRMAERLRVKRYSASTQATYLSCTKTFLDWCGPRPAHTLELPQLNQYVLHLVDRGAGRSLQNQHVNAVKFLYEQVLGRDRFFLQMHRPRKNRVLPERLHPDEMQALIAKVTNLKHRAIVLTLIGTGLRVGELLSLKISDIDSKTMLVHVRQGKGAKDRSVPLTPDLLELLRIYFKAYRPKEFLFEGQNGGPYSNGSVNKIIKRAASAAGIRKKVHAHTLRHSYATFALENGVDIRYIQALLGHNSIKTTEIYTHVSRAHLQNIPNPISAMRIFEEDTGVKPERK